jgi:hypothetical protein
VVKKNIANNPDATKNMATFAARMVRSRKMLSRTSGSIERRSMSRNVASSAIAIPPTPIVWSDAQPFS